MLACLKMKEKIVQLLIDHGADVQVKDKVNELKHSLQKESLSFFLERRSLFELHRDTEKPIYSRVYLERVQNTWSIS